MLLLCQLFYTGGGRGLKCGSGSQAKRQRSGGYETMVLVICGSGSQAKRQRSGGYEMRVVVVYIYDGTRSNDKLDQREIDRQSDR